MDVAELAGFDPDELGSVFACQPAPHRFPGSMARRVQALCQLVVAPTRATRAAIWTTAPDGRELLNRVAALPGFGQQKAKIFVALLGGQLGVTPPGWQAACAPFGENGGYRCIADITSPESRIKVRDCKNLMKAAAKVAST
jgi:uncharacterized HhH-GPD family protein